MNNGIVIEYFLITTAIAGLAILWRNWLADHPSWKKCIKKILGKSHKALLCGSCFTYWVTFIVVLIWSPLFNTFEEILFAESSIIVYLFTWMSFSFGAIFLRFLYVLIQENVSVIVHRDSKHSH